MCKVQNSSPPYAIQRRWKDRLAGLGIIGQEDHGLKINYINNIISSVIPILFSLQSMAEKELMKNRYVPHFQNCHQLFS